MNTLSKVNILTNNYPSFYLLLKKFSLFLDKINMKSPTKHLLGLYKECLIKF